MYKIIGVDGKHYGPVTEEQLREWIGAGRANSQTLVQKGETTEPKSLSTLPEFTEALAARCNSTNQIECVHSLLCMYKIIGIDGKQYGPVTQEQLREWIGAGRANSRTLVQKGETTERKLLSTLPEFTEALAPRRNRDSQIQCALSLLFILACLVGGVVYLWNLPTSLDPDSGRTRIEDNVYGCRPYLVHFMNNNRVWVVNTQEPQEKYCYKWEILKKETVSVVTDQGHLVLRFHFNRTGLQRSICVEESTMSSVRRGDVFIPTGADRIPGIKYW